MVSEKIPQRAPSVLPGRSDVIGQFSVRGGGAVEYRLMYVFVRARCLAGHSRHYPHFVVVILFADIPGTWISVLVY